MVKVITFYSGFESRLNLPNQPNIAQANKNKQKGPFLKWCIMVFTELIKVLVVAVFFKKKVNNNARLQLLPIKNKLEYFAKSGHTAANQESVWPDLAKFRHFGEEKLYFWKFM